ncbi:DUF2635 domain-containing protein [Methylogaea oryzae]|uniref:DUF2635 domain-containing protein n=1 Tax=Methylogaea oryzae TaxID=1295382 RepID=A0A8D4VLC6_9GAMM|nr:DUF2635 domain-containing protein [Methylogaea oryzae]BBL69696.1 hypothetical protein MoryE10_03020 [Methylogaea oryzae]
MDKLFLKPAINPATNAPYLIRMPENSHQHLPADGTVVPNNRYWREHLKDGSVEVVEPAKAPAKPKAEPVKQEQ